MITLTDLLKPSLVKNDPDNIKLNTTHNRVIAAVGYPRQIKEGWLNNLIASDGNYDISMHIKPSPIQNVLSKLNHELVKQKSDIMAADLKGIVNPSLHVQHNDTLKTLERLQLGEERLFDFSLYVNARARTKKKLDLLGKKIESEMNSMMIIPKTPNYQMLSALQSVLPIGRDDSTTTETLLQTPWQPASPSRPLSSISTKMASCLASTMLTKSLLFSIPTNSQTITVSSSDRLVPANPFSLSSTSFEACSIQSKP